ncbi:MAG TPA: hypothetical protein VGJ45_09770 [Pseudonocardiaceae bacterium]|jgi:hypothetical protein
MNTVARRICLALLALYGAYSGLWGYLAPDSWYQDFPGLGLHWVTPFGPYNEHFVKDINAMFLGAAILAVVAFVLIGAARLTCLAGATWTTFNAVHLAFHLRHLDMLGPTDRVAGTVSLVVVLVLSALLLIPLRTREPAPGPARVDYRAVLALLALTGFGTGIWASAAPENWYATFPGLGLSWLPQLGPYDEHLAADVGAMFLAFGVLTAFAFVRAGDHRVLRVTGLSWLVFNVLHLIYHLRMLGMYRPTDQVLNAVLLSVLAVLPLFLLFATKKRGGSRVDGTESGTTASAGRVHAGAERVQGVDAAGNGDPQRH